MNLQWIGLRGNRATIGNQAVDPNGGSLTVTPTGSTTYTLVVENELGRTERTVEIRVGAAGTPTARP